LKTIDAASSSASNPFLRPALIIFALLLAPVLALTSVTLGQDSPVQTESPAITIQMPDGSIITAHPATDEPHADYIAESLPPQSASSKSTFVPESLFEWFLFVFGLLAQATFMSRFFVQWLASERAKKSVVPNAFWWLSLAGSTMLLLYFTLRHDPIGMLGQGFGWIVYSRNLKFIYFPHHKTSD